MRGGVGCGLVLCMCVGGGGRHSVVVSLIS